ncbi:hypothetical protein, partial [Mesorhizobium sp. M1E.F.Ca.ET.063.01.1.1]|uniref:hypothetical protein n=1 Tax=Mesorhizobium sp. M1E.F.Ca.ET.063.01.1.1 TaxID=2496750 RepID=UPI001AECCD26
MDRQEQAGRQGEELGSLRQFYPAGLLQVFALPVLTDFKSDPLRFSKPAPADSAGRMASDFPRETSKAAERSAGVV